MWKYVSLFVVVVCLHYNSHAQKNPTTILGTVPIDKVTSIDATEVTIQEYVYFIINNYFDAAYFPNPQYVSPATKHFFEILRSQDPNYIKTYNQHKAIAVNYGLKSFKLTENFLKLLDGDFPDFSIYNPIVGISFKQAQQFCKWREKLVNESKVAKVKITLPSIEIYKKINNNKDSVTSNFKVDNCNRFQFNYAHEKCIPSKKAKHLQSEGQDLVRADSYRPTSLKIYNMQGNAAEMTSYEGIAVGGSFRHFANESFNDKVQSYNKEEDWLGFRCLITLF